MPMPTDVARVAPPDAAAAWWAAYHAALRTGRHAAPEYQAALVREFRSAKRLLVAVLMRVPDQCFEDRTGFYALAPGLDGSPPYPTWRPMR